jgi:hypothetical protein
MPPRVKPRRLLLLLALIPFTALRVSAGCAAQSEGQLCNTLNNTNADCSAGLICQTFGSGTLGACCPPPPTVSTHPACVQSGNTGTGTATGGSGGSSTTSSGTTTSSSTTSTTTTTGTGDAGTDGSSNMLDGGDGG